jgi:hypothetical protein
VIVPDHDCFWTRGRRSTLWRIAGAGGGAGLPRGVLAAVARRLNVAVSSAGAPEDEYTETLMVGPWGATLHDGCFLHLEADTAAVREAFTTAALELHEGYLGAAPGPRAAAAVNGRLEEGAELLLRSLPHRRELRLQRYPKSAGWWQRRLSPTIRFDV